MFGKAFQASSTRPGRFSCRWLRKARASPNAQLELHARLTHRAPRSREPFGARAPRRASLVMRCPGKDAHAPSPPSRAQVRVTTSSTASLAELALEVLLHAGLAT